MHRPAAFLIAALATVQAAQFDGARALDYTRRTVEFGPRPPGSAALARLRNFLVTELKGIGCNVEVDRFTGWTPRGPIPMANVIATFAGSSGRVVVVSGHYDTKLMPEIRFVGANDGGSSTGFLLEMARVLARRSRVHTVKLVWFDGEEAIEQWSDRDSLYGSRHLAAKWEREGILKQLLALINVDMIGDRQLGIHRDYFSTRWLRDLVWQVAGELGYTKHFLSAELATEDDHLPFLQRGASAVNLIDFHYPDARNSYWHTEQDTLDKLSAGSFQVVGEVVLETLRRLEQRR
jgi:glutaminyl-peptide cyclotransferase